MEAAARVAGVSKKAGDLIVRLMTENREIREKLPGDLVTDADRSAEDLVIAEIRKHSTGAILTEEAGLVPGSGDERWIVDPLDGTTNYSHGYPFFCVSVALEKSGETVAGAVYAPLLGELFVAEKGAGATLNGVRVSVSKIASLARSLLCTGFSPRTCDLNAPFFRAIYPRTQGVRHDGSAALNLAYVAAGRFDAYWEFNLKIWDYAAGVLLVREAGGVVSAALERTLPGVEHSILASNPAIHEELSQHLQAVDQSSAVI